MSNTIHRYFQQNVQAYATCSAIEAGGRAYSYESFAERVDKIHKVLTKAGLKQKAIIVWNDHSVDAYAAILAINFSGNTILPLDPAWPGTRVSAVCKLVSPAAVLYFESSGDLASFHEKQNPQGLPVLNCVSGATITTAPGKESMSADYPGIAYILFTSGSTGVPKGVPVRQDSLEAFLAYYKTYDFNAADRFLQVYDITFDVAYFSFLVPLCVGACCCILNNVPNVPRNLSILQDLLKRNITVVSMVPSVINFSKRYLRKEVAPVLRYSFFSGDALFHSELIEWQQFVPNARIHNYYGLTETTIVCTGYIWEEKRGAEDAFLDRVPIGKPFPGMQAVIISETGDRIANGDIGELAFHGLQVFDGYLHLPTPEKFVWISKGEEKVLYYKTGDLVSLNANEQLIFHGRSDDQVKINGYRIELGEIQLAIQRVTNQKAVVLKKQNTQKIDYLKAFIEGNSVDEEWLKQVLHEHLPAYMVPTVFVPITEWPLNENGKIDMLYLKKMDANV
jgi:amino acid adenylation domain-containing protein